MVTRIFIFLMFVAIASAATALSKLPPIPLEFAGKEGCFITQINDVVPFGAEVTPIGKCLRINCGERYIHYASCGVVGTDDPKCHITEYDNTKPYPNCCPTISCNNINDIENNDV